MSVARRPDYDAFRAIAAAFVAFSHWFPEIVVAQSFMWGRTGVIFFFVLSGMFIGRLLEGLSAEKEAPGYSVFFIFLYGRLLRIIPPYLFVVFVVWLSGYIYIQDKLYALLLFLSNIDILNGSLYGHGVHLWSIAVEVQFYALWGLLYVVSPAQRRRLYILAFLLVGPVWRFCSTSVDSGGWVLASFIIPGCVDSFAIGLLLVSPRKLRFPEIIVLLSGGGALVSIGLVGFQPLLALGVSWFVATYDILAAIFAAGVILTCDKYRLQVCGFFVVKKILGPLGLVSYSFYLWHYFAIPFWGYFDISVASNFVRLALYSLFTLFLATVSWFFIEKPSRALRYRSS